MNSQNTTLEIDGILCQAIIGCFDYERTATQDLDISLELELGCIETADNVDNTVDYWKLCDLVKQFVEASNFSLLESLSAAVVAELFQTYQLIKAIKLSICKLSLSNQKSRSIKCHLYQRRQYKVAIALGSNMHNPRQQLISAIELLSEVVSQVKVGKIYKSSPFGFTEQEDFYNTCISGYTELEPEQLLVFLKKLEKQQGKQELFVNGPRVIDLDIIFFGNSKFSSGWLKILHQAMHERDFVLLPLSDIEPDWVHPELDLSVHELLNNTTIGKYIISE